MEKKDFLNWYGENQDRFIPGIFNYCDRWCEKCPFTSRCSVYAMEEKDGSRNKVVHDLENKMFWEKLGDMMKLTLELVVDMAEEQGIDLDNLDYETAKEENKELEETASKHLLSELSLEYADKNRNWFELNKPAIEEKENEIIKRTELNIPSEKAEAELLRLSDYIEVIRWYTFQIHIKIKRALMHGDPDPEYEDLIQNDQNGSAKIALIGVKRSIAAWVGMLKEFPGQEDEILNLLVLLEKLRNGINKTFPDVMKFNRPGFDS